MKGATSNGKAFSVQNRSASKASLKNTGTGQTITFVHAYDVGRKDVLKKLKKSRQMPRDTFVKWMECGLMSLGMLEIMEEPYVD